MRDGQTPSSFLFDELRKHAGISNRDAAWMILSDRPIYAGRSPRDRVTERTFLSREVVHVQPSRINPSIYGDFALSAQTITSRLVAAQGYGAEAYARICNRYGGEAARHMAALLDAYGREGQIYLNAVMRVLSAKLTRESDRAVLLVLAFVSAGCLADPRLAADVVHRFTREKLAMEIGTVYSGGGPGTIFSLNGDEALRMGLVRLFGNAQRPPIYPLSQEPQGTVVGSLPVEGSCITDVEVDVSRRHLIIWFEGNTWWCKGLGSTNGTVLIKGQSGESLVVEPARGRGPQLQESQSFPLEPGDILCLGRRTRFLALQIGG